MKRIVMTMAVTAALFLAACTAQNAVSAPADSDSAPEASTAAEASAEVTAEEETATEVTTAEVSASYLSSYGVWEKREGNGGERKR